MNIPQAFRCAKAWNRGRSGALHIFCIKQMVVDDVHRIRLLLEILLERDWLTATLNGRERAVSDGTLYTRKDYGDLQNLIDVVVNSEAGEKLE